MTRESIYVIGPTGVLTHKTPCCLRTDSWNDYIAFVIDSETALTTGNYRNGNRFLRAAIWCLFAHIEGVVNAIYARKTIPAVFSGDRLCDRTRNIDAEAKKHGHVPYVSFRFEKHLRDLIAHPGINVAFSDRRTFPRTLDQDSVSDHLDIATLKRLGGRISPWLDAICTNLGVSRFTDAKARSKEAGEFLCKEAANTTRETKDSDYALMLKVSEEPPIADNLPIKWPDDSFILAGYEPSCSQCVCPITESDHVRGHISRVDDAVVVIRSVAHCRPCDFWNASHVRIRSDENGQVMELLEW